MNAIFICVIVLVKMCFTCSIFVDLNTKRFECFRCFWKVLCFYKNWKISKTVLPCFGDSVVGHPSRMLQPRVRVLILVTCSWVKGPVARGTQRFSRLSSRLPREWDVQSWKTLSKFFQNFWLEVFWRLDLATCWRLNSVAKNACFAFLRTVFQKFLVFSSSFNDCSLSSPKYLSQTLRVFFEKSSIFAPCLLQTSRKR